jgi:hypothetical protein
VWKNGAPKFYYQIRRLVWHVLLYPLCVLVFWGPNGTYMLIFLIKLKSNKNFIRDMSPNDYVLFYFFNRLGALWCYFFGIACSCIFFYNSPEVRYKLKILIYNKILSKYFPSIFLPIEEEEKKKKAILILMGK